jgi:AcrR family transcriptional regulator
MLGMDEDVGLRERKKLRTREAIADAALRLFAEHGFDAVTLTQIAAAADVGARTLFRYFPDKEELLFGDDDSIGGVLAAALAARPRGESPADAAREALLTLLPLWQEGQEKGRARQAVIAASPALRARERSKLAAYERVVTTGLVARGADEPTARLLARAVVPCLHEGITRWLADADPRAPGIEARGRQAFAELAALLAPGPGAVPKPG